MSNFVLHTNPNLSELNEDYLYHMALKVEDTRNPTAIRQQFGDVRFVLMGGTASRMLELARRVNEEVYDGTAVTGDFVDLCAAGQRYALYKVGAVLCCSHGVGMSTMSVILHEMLKLVHYAGCVDPIFLRVGTCGGIGVAPGTVIISVKGFNGYLSDQHEIAILGERVKRPAQFNQDVVEALVSCAEASDNFATVRGNTLGAECFYEGQARLDGASCAYTEEEKMKFLQRCKSLDIKNFEMEAPMFSSLTKHVGVRAGSVCVALLNRLLGDQVPKERKAEHEQNPFVIICRFIKRTLEKSQ